MTQNRVLIIDNYDSFTYNLAQVMAVLCGPDQVQVVRNDAVQLDGLMDIYAPSHIILSPGPCTPNEAGRCNELLQQYAGQLPILGVCLGHQCIAQVFGGTVVRAQRCMHGKTSMVAHDGCTIFTGIPSPFQVMRYHSLMIDPDGLSEDFEITARTLEGEIMGIRSRKLRVEGVQFHPESFATDFGQTLLQNFLELA